MPNRNAYSNLLSQYTPQVIETEEEYNRALAIAEKLTFAKNRTLEEKALHKLIVTLIEAYETENYLIERKTLTFFCAQLDRLVQQTVFSLGSKELGLVGWGLASGTVNGLGKGLGVTSGVIGLGLASGALKGLGGVSGVIGLGLASGALKGLG